MRSALRVLFAPIMLIGFNGAAVWIVVAHASLFWLGPLLMAAIGFAAGVEQIIPFEPTWNRGQGDSARDLTHAVVNQAINLSSVAIIPVFGFLHPWGSVWPNAWPLAAQLLLAVIVADAGISLAHYFSHRWPWLWRFHAVHHSLNRMYAFNGLMKHPVHQAIEIASGGALLVILGMPPLVGLLLAFAVAVQLLLQHSNADMRIGPLAWLLAIAPVHRRHHRRAAEAYGVNFGLFTNLWDHLLGTADVGQAARVGPGDLGIEDWPDYPQSYAAQVARPFARAPLEAPARAGEVLP
jgi:sterol desaturase/sphingolipid hydroxylase (fatty acid hydroxylase superfamily)